MKCLSIRHPWAWAIIRGIKKIENRSWTTPYRGPLLIHAGKSMAEFGRDFSSLIPNLPDTSQLGFGAIIGMVHLKDIVTLDIVKNDPFAEGPWCWVLENPREMNHVPWRGEQGLFDVNPPIFWKEELPIFGENSPQDIK